MKQNLFLKFLFAAAILYQTLTSAQIAVTKIYTDYNGFWTSGTSASPNPVYPDNSHNLLGFVWNGKTYSTGVNDTLLQSQTTVDYLSKFTALPVSSVPSASLGNTFIGVGKNYGGSGNVSPVPVSLPLQQYLIDGEHGLDLGTAIFNFPSSGQLEFDVSSISASSIGDGIPDLIFTQLGDISNVTDTFSFQDNAGNTVGTVYSVNFSSVADIGIANWKFYYVTNPPSYNSGPSGDGKRKLRLLAIDWSALGLTSSNITEIAKFVQKFSGQSDMAFVAYNQSSISVKQQVSGFVYNDNNAGTLDGNVLSGVTVQLKTISGAVLSTTTTDANGFYQFNNVGGGTYYVVVNLTGAYANYKVVSDSDGAPLNQITVAIDNAASSGNNFGINLPPVAIDDELAVDTTIPGSIDLYVNDYDENNGVVVPSTISLVPPSGAVNVTTDSDGDIVSFEIDGEGKWEVDQAGVFTFTGSGLTSTISDAHYTIKDEAGLVSNNALIHIKTDGFCYKDEVISGTQLPTKMGITSLKRAGTDGDNWPMVRQGGWLALESPSKGFVINRIATTAALNTIPNPVEGMIVYDQEAKCIKIFTTLDNGVSYGWHCYVIQSCPD